MKRNILNRVALDNIRDHQIGGQRDGITQEVAADIGFVGHGETDAISEFPVEEGATAMGGLKRVRDENADVLGDSTTIREPDFYPAYRQD